ncbi:MAG TPA: large conductance mechanosensitive channel protein MscL [Gemmatimonadaceae bacterium]|nr:large conductance mechanosensitive channel protein MscL [Gemmatimonadaceae bacterium]
MWKDFKAFIMRGNVVDLAVGVIIGAAFGAIVKSLVDDIIMPPIGLATGGLDFSNKFILLKEGAKAAGPYASLADAKGAGAVTLNYGVFVNNIITFLIIAAAVFLLVRMISKLHMEQVAMAPPASAPTTKACPYCATQIPIPAKRCPNCTSQLT